MFFAVLFLGRDLWMPSDRVDPENIPSSLVDENRIAVSHSFKDGVHRYTGTFLLPHSCFSVDKVSTYQDGKIKISFTITDVFTTEDVCVKVKTRFPFSFIIEAPQDTPVTFFLNGRKTPSFIREVKWQSIVGTFINNSVTSLKP
jgi:hypothetical protein